MKLFTIITLLLFGIVSALFSTGAEDKMSDMDSMDSGPFIEYTDMEAAKALAVEGPTVLFFYASWCPSCKAAEKDFIKSSDSIKNINLIMVDYDNSEDLQNQFGVTYQHTYVQISSEGMMINKWNGGATEELLKNIN